MVRMLISAAVYVLANADGELAEALTRAKAGERHDEKLALRL